MHLTRRITSTFEFVLGNTPIIEVPVFTIAYYVALGNVGGKRWHAWHTHVYHFICCRLMGLDFPCHSTKGFLNMFTYYKPRMSIFSGFEYRRKVYPAGTHIIEGKRIANLYGDIYI